MATEKNKFIIFFLLVIIIITSAFSASLSGYKSNQNYLDVIQYIRNNAVTIKLTSLFLSFIFALLLNVFSNKNIIVVSKLALLFIPFKLYLVFNHLYQNSSIIGIQEFIFFIVMIITVSTLTNKISNYKLDLFLNITIIILLINLLQISVNFQDMFIGGRFVSITGNANHAGLIFSTLSIYTWALFYKSRNIKHLLLFISSFILLNFTGSRTGFLHLFIFLILYMYPIVSRKKTTLLIPLLAILFLILTFSSGYELNFKNNTVFDRLDLDSNRLEIWRHSMNIFVENPFFGQTLKSDSNNYIESSYIACLSNYGIIGLLFLSLPVLYIVKTYFKIPNKSSLRSRRKLLIYSFLSALLVAAGFEAFLLANISFIYICIFIFPSMIEQENITLKLK